MKVLDSKIQENSVTMPVGARRLAGDLRTPVGATGMVIFAHGSGSSRFSPRNQSVARNLQEHGLGTLLFDLLTEAEERQDSYTAHLRFDISLLAERLIAVTNWISQHETTHDLPLGYFGSSTGAAAALVAAAMDHRARAIVSRGGRPDLAGEDLGHVRAPVLLIVGENDGEVIELNERAREKLKCKNSISVIPRATHLFEEPGALEEVSRLAAEFFAQHLK
ncbi:MAG TPA: alpha/beta family hydrolase [Verrucomicrobiae bacterium]|jgi:dienelactone hydrolase|nr:alpha/beta family hydrolase [Verrucomicrobiae bacterium]